MAQYRRRATVVEAYQWKGGLEGDGIVEYFDPDPGGRDAGWMAVKTPNGYVRVEPGEWIITGVHGEHYPCKPEIFAATYDLVPETGEKPVSDEPPGPHLFSHAKLVQFVAQAAQQASGEEGDWTFWAHEFIQKNLLDV